MCVGFFFFYWYTRTVLFPVTVLSNGKEMTIFDTNLYIYTRYTYIRRSTSEVYRPDCRNISLPKTKTWWYVRTTSPFMYHIIKLSQSPAAYYMCITRGKFLSFFFLLARTLHHTWCNISTCYL